MPLQIDSILPTSINAAAGTVVPINCEASGGQVSDLDNFTITNTLCSHEKLNSKQVRITAANGGYEFRGITLLPSVTHMPMFNMKLNTETSDASYFNLSGGSYYMMILLFNSGNQIEIDINGSSTGRISYSFGDNTKFMLRSTFDYSTLQYSIYVETSTGVLIVSKSKVLTIAEIAQNYYLIFRNENANGATGTMLVDLVNGVSSVLAKTLKDTSDSSIISNTLPYNYTANSADNKKTFELSVSDGFTTKSNLINVNIHDVTKTSNYGEFAWIF